MTFAYTALEPSGKKRSGVLDAPSREAAMETLAADGRFVLDIAEHVVKAEKTRIGLSRSVSRRDLAMFTRRLSDLSAAGLPLDRVIAVLAEQSESPLLSEICLEVLSEVRSGRPVSDALAMHPKYFNKIFTQTLRAGEASGQFPEVAQRLADLQEQDVRRRGKISTALTYPLILGVTAILVVVFILTYIVPKLTPVFKNLGDSLPITTKMLLGITDVLTHDYVFIIGAILAILFGFRAWVATEQGAIARDRFLLKAPIFGPVIRKSTVSRFARILGTLVYGGVPILEAIELSGLAAGNRVFMKSSEQVQNDVKEGRGIAVSMRDAGSNAFPSVLTNMVAVGEETGNLPTMLNRVADSLDFEVESATERLTALFEPLIILTMGTFVGFVVLSVLLPIYQAQDVVK